MSAIFQPPVAAVDLHSPTAIGDVAPNTVAATTLTAFGAVSYYLTFTDASNYEKYSNSTVSNYYQIQTSAAGTGTERDLSILAGNTASNGGQIYIQVDGTINFSRNFIAGRWKITPDGHYVTFTDNTYDIGAAGTARPRTVYAATSVLAPNIPVADTGWTGNADSGSKTAVIPNSATVATAQTALNLLAAGTGDLVAATAQKVKAIETALVALLVPNA